MYRYCTLAWIVGAWAGVVGCGGDNDEGNLATQCQKTSECDKDQVCNLTERRCEAGYNDFNGVFSDKLVLGNSSSTKTGTSKNLSLSMVAGIEAYLAAMNSTGGLYGRTFVLDQRDDGYDADRAKENVTAMVKPIGAEGRKVFALIGNMGSPTSQAAMPVAIAYKTIFYAALSGADHLRGDSAGKYVFNYRAGYREQARDLSKYFTQTRLPNVIHPRNIAVFAQGTTPDGRDKCTYPAAGERRCESDESKLSYKAMDAYGLSGFEGMANELSRLGVKMYEIPFATHTRNLVDILKPVQHLLEWLGRPKGTGEYGDGGTSFDACILLQVIDVPAAAFVRRLTDEIENIRINNASSSDFTLTDVQISEIKKLRRLDYGATVLSQTFADELKNTNPAKYCRNVIASQAVPHPTMSNQAVALEFREHMSQFRKGDPKDIYSFEGYIVAKIFVAALEKQGPAITTESLIGTLESMNKIDIGLGVSLGFSPNDHQASHRTWAQQLNSKCEWIDFKM